MQQERTSPTSGRRLLASLVTVAALSATVTAIAPSVAGAGVAATPDFNGDGRADFVINASQEDWGSAVDTGAVDVLYGSGPDQLLSKKSPGVPGEPGTDDKFGDYAPTGDFNGDGYDDLAVGAWGEAVSNKSGAGRAYVFYGTKSGLSTSTAQIIDQNTSGIPDQAETDDQFAHVVASGDFNADGYDDLAIGVPRENVGTVVDPGIVQVLFGASTGLRTDNSLVFQQGSGVVGDVQERSDDFGAALDAGDFDRDGFTDLAIGAPEEDLGSAKVDAGSVHVLFSGAGTTLGTRGAMFTGDSLGMPEPAQTDDRFGCVMLTGDFNGDGFIDLAAGADGRTVSGVTLAGAAFVLYGGPLGLSTLGSQLFSQATPGIADDPESLDNFGDSLAAGDFNGDGIDELAISDDKEDLPGVSGTDQGAVELLYGTSAGLTTSGSVFITQETWAVPDSSEDLDIFGSYLKTVDYNGDGVDDLYVAASGESIGSFAQAGQLTLLPGGPAGLGSVAGIRLNQNSAGISDFVEAQDRFGDS